MNILYITTEGFDTINANNHLNLSLIEDLLKAGNNVILMQSKRSNEESVPLRLSVYKSFKSIEIFRNKIEKKKMILRGLNEIKFYKDIFAYFKHHELNVDIVYYQSSGLSFYFVPKLQKIINKPIIMNIQDLFPESVKSTRKLMLYPIILVIGYLQKKTYKLITKFIVISEDVRYLLSKKGVSESKIEVVQNWYDDEVIYPVVLSDNKFMMKYSLTKKKFIVQYAGNLGYVLDYNFLTKLALFLINNNDILIQIVGDGSNKEYLTNLCKEHNISNIEIFPIQPLEIVRDVYSFADLCLIPLKKGVIFHSVPSKASVAMACSTPIIVICDTESFYAKDINHNKVGKCFNSDEVEEAAKFILDISSNIKKHQDFKKNAIEYATSKLNRQINTKKIIDVIENVKEYNKNGRKKKTT